MDRCNWIVEKTGLPCSRYAHEGRDYCYAHWRITCHETDKAIALMELEKREKETDQTGLSGAHNIGE